MRPARPGEDAPDEVTAAWVSARAGLARVVLMPLCRALAWRVDAPGSGGPGARLLVPVPPER